MNCKEGLLVIPPKPLSVYTTEPRQPNLNPHLCLLLIRISPSAWGYVATSLTPGFQLLGPRHGADYFRVAHLEVGGTISGCLGADLRRYTAQLVPSPAVETE